MIYLLNQDEQVFKIVPTEDILELWQTDGINEIDTLEGSIKVTKEYQQAFESAFLFGVQDIDERYTFHLYKNITATVTNSEIQIYGINIAFDELKSKAYIQDRRPTDQPIRSVLDWMLKGTGWEIGEIDGRLPQVSASFYYEPVLDALSDLLKNVGGEIEFKVAISGSEITQRYVNIKKQRGRAETGKRFVYGSNTLSIVKEQDTAELYTAIVPRGRGEEVSDGSNTATGQAGYGRRITIKDVVWSKASGDPVDKPAGQEMLEIPEATETFGHKDGSPRIRIEVFEDTEDPELLIQQGYDWLNQRVRPQVQFKSTVESTGDLYVGDVVTIIRHDLGIKYQTRVFKVKRNYLNNKLTQIELGDVINESPAKKQANFERRLSRAVEDVQRGIQNTFNIASDGTMITYGEHEPETKKVNDLWYEVLPDGTVRMRQWNGEEWIILVDDAFAKEVEGRVQEALDEIAKMDAEISNVDERVRKIVSEYGFDGIEEINVEINRIEDTVGRIETDIERIERVDIGSLRDEIQSVSATAEGTVQMIGANGLNLADTNYGQIGYQSGETFQVKAEEAGFQPGRTYTLSFEQLCAPVMQLGTSRSINIHQGTATEVETRIENQ